VVGGVGYLRDFSKETSHLSLAYRPLGYIMSPAKPSLVPEDKKEPING
jgi:hypothetical protein